jgi:hypothetical protein
MPPRKNAETIAAIAAIWAAIRDACPELPELPVGINTRRAIHCGAAARDIAAGVPTPTVVLNAADVSGATRAEVAALLLHEAAHIIARQRGLAETSKYGDYHNATFKDLAEELGGVTEYGDPQHGYVIRGTTIPALRAGASKVLAAQISQTTVRPARNYTRGECACGRVIRAAPTVWAKAPIICGACGASFVQAPA